MILRGLWMKGSSYRLQHDELLLQSSSWASWRVATNGCSLDLRLVSKTSLNTILLPSNKALLFPHSRPRDFQHSLLSSTCLSISPFSAIRWFSFLKSCHDRWIPVGPWKLFSPPYPEQVIICFRPFHYWSRGFQRHLFFSIRCDKSSIMSLILVSRQFSFLTSY